jgi:hypothetical protein
MTSPAELSPPMNHVFVDFENVHQIDLSIIGDKSVSFMLLVGASQTKFNVELVEKLMERAASIQLERLKSSGKNALDFALSFYVGRAVAADPTGYFHIISKDKGFDPLIEHLRSRNIRARRHNDFAELSFTAPPKPAAIKSPSAGSPSVPPKAQIAPKNAAAKPRSDALSRVLAGLRKNPKSRPGTRTALLHYIQTLMAWPDEAKAAKFVGKLEKDGHLSLSDKGAVTYPL